MNIFSSLSYIESQEKAIISHIKEGEVPKHVAFIMDGNRRWAKQRGLPSSVGHWKGAEALTEITEVAMELGIEVITVFSFSTENWLRGQEEVESLMELFEKYLEKQREYMLSRGVRLGCIGDIDALPPSLASLLRAVEEETKDGAGITLVLALNYGSRNEITRACKAVSRKVVSGEIEPDEINEQTIEQHLDTAKYGMPDFLIRTSGEMRLSNFLLWQISYAEIYVTTTLWPEFRREQLCLAIEQYQKRTRKFGG